MPTSNAEELGLFLKCTVIGRGVFGPWACWKTSGCTVVFISGKNLLNVTTLHQYDEVC